MDFAQNQQLDIFVRYHDASRIFELKRCLLSLVGQAYRPTNIFVIAQRFNSVQLEELTKITERYSQLGLGAPIKVLNYGEAQPRDARAALLNLGIQSGSGRYLAFLDYDDSIQYTGYKALIEVLRTGDATIAFGGVAAKYAIVEGDYLITRVRKILFQPHSGLSEQFVENHCPINSFVIDRSRIKTEDLYFDETLSKNEDYDFLLRVGARYLSDFSQKKTITADYYLKDDCSNTILLSQESDKVSKRLWKKADECIDLQRKNIVISPTVQRSLGLPPSTTPLTIADYIRYKLPKDSHLPEINARHVRRPR